MAMVLTDEELRRRGHSVPIYRAIEAAGGVVAVAFHLGMTTTLGPTNWYQRGSVPARRLLRLCELGNYKVTPEEIVADMEARAEDKKKEKAMRKEQKAGSNSGRGAGA